MAGISTTFTTGLATDGRVGAGSGAGAGVAATGGGLVTAGAATAATGAGFVGAAMALLVAGALGATGFGSGGGVLFGAVLLFPQLEVLAMMNARKADIKKATVNLIFFILAEIWR